MIHPIYPLQYLPSGHVFVHRRDDCAMLAAALEETGYDDELCLSLDFDPAFIARLMAAGFLVMSCALENDEKSGVTEKNYILMPKHHLIRSCLFFPDLHIKKSVQRLLSKYELRFDVEFDRIIDTCVAVYGDGWLTAPLVDAIKKIRRLDNTPARPVSFGLYRGGQLVAGEFGIVAGTVYTSYSGYHDEDNAGTVQMILLCRYLEKNGFAFWDLGMPLDYKLTLGAREISRGEFLDLFGKALHPRIIPIRNA
jgi:Leu/Phe-tRNA-protein transferase